MVLSAALYPPRSASLNRQQFFHNSSSSMESRHQKSAFILHFLCSIRRNNIYLKGKIIFYSFVNYAGKIDNTFIISDYTTFNKVQINGIKKFVKLNMELHITTMSYKIQLLSNSKSSLIIPVYNF